MEITSSRIVQMDSSKPRNKCRKWKLVANYKVGNKYKEKTHRFTGSITDAKNALDEFIDDLENGSIHRTITFNNYSNQWLNYREMSNSFSPNTLDTNRYTIKRLNSIFGKYKLDELTPELLKKGLLDVPLTSSNKEKQTTNSYKRKLHKTMKSILNEAIIDGYLDENPLNNIPIPKRDTKERTALSKEQFDYLINLLSKRELNGFNVAIQLICYLGLRRGEVVALTWDDYNKKEQTITINHALKEKNHSLGEPKSKSSRRTIPLSENTQKLLQAWKEEYSKVNLDTNFICCNNQGKLMHPQNLRRWWSKTILETNNKRFNEEHKGMLLPKISLHELKHTNLTLMARFMSPFDLQNYAGWSDLAPAKIYIHKDQETLRKAICNANL